MVPKTTWKKAQGRRKVSVTIFYMTKKAIMASHKKDTEANISTFAHYANELSDAALTRAVYRNQNDQGARFEDLWNLLGTLVSTDNPGRSRPPTAGTACAPATAPTGRGGRCSGGRGSAMQTTGVQGPLRQRIPHPVPLDRLLRRRSGLVGPLAT